MLGTRSEFIKLSPVTREATRRRRPFRVGSTSEHYSHLLDRVSIDTLDLPAPRGGRQPIGHGRAVGQTLAALRPRGAT